jgi:prepilin-type N-terminal cleavage/methylation domain-containing protein
MLRNAPLQNPLAHFGNRPSSCALRQQGFEIAIVRRTPFRYKRTVKVPWESWRWLPQGRWFCYRAPKMRAAFTLIEMLITLALMLIMMIMLYGFGSQGHQQRQKKACQKNLQKIYVALEIFANEHDGAFPRLADATTAEEPLALLVPRYTADTSCFICPGSKDAPLPSGESFAKRRISYAYFMGRQLANSAELLMTDKQVNTQQKIAGDGVFSTTGKLPGNNHHKYGGNYLFCDGRMEMSSARAPFPLVWPEGVMLLNPKP